ncbi:MazG-like family protein [Ferviditalea candida]|uniref:MazG-like family protein n=1 Tax=Ferviditalea candida TaxID=3108399 RepID=A0ABU5ZMV3_9BACL|nr:MazG-like family protein [Paenibacillaceae bacterium T2]
MNTEHDVDLAKRAKVIEWLKTEVIDQVSRLFKGIWEGRSSRIADSLASLIVSCYILGRRLGIPYHTLDESIVQKLKKHREEGHQLEDWYQDISILEEHVRKR